MVGNADVAFFPGWHRRPKINIPQRHPEKIDDMVMDVTGK
jgi:hypothetical protein